MVRVLCLPENVIIMAQEEPLFLSHRVMHDAHASNKVHDLSAGRVEQVVACLIAAIAVHPFQPELAGWCCAVNHPGVHGVEFIMPNHHFSKMNRFYKFTCKMITRWLSLLVKIVRASVVTLQGSWLFAV